ncbi:MAG: hypothetical protein ACLSAH_17330 [Bilophila wadsworthia]
MPIEMPILVSSTACTISGATSFNRIRTRYFSSSERPSLSRFPSRSSTSGENGTPSRSGGLGLRTSQPQNAAIGNSSVSTRAKAMVLRT